VAIALADVEEQAGGGASGGRTSRGRWWSEA